MPQLDKTGFSLLEVILALSILAVIGTLIATIMIQSNGVFLKQAARVTIGIGLNNATSVINDTISQASAVVNQYPVQGTAQYTSNPQTLVTSIPAIDPSGNSISGISDYVILTRDVQKSYVFKKIIFPDQASSRKSADTVLVTNLSLIEFQYLDNSDVPVSPNTATKIKYTINTNQSGNTINETASSSGKVNLRNN